MNWESVITTTVGGLPATLAALYAWRNSKGAKQSAEGAGRQMTEIHLVVNSQREAMMAEITTLKAEVVAAKAEVVAAKAEIVAARSEIITLKQVQKAAD